MMAEDIFTHLGSKLAGLMFVWAMFKQFFPQEVRQLIEKYFQKAFTYVHPHIQITFPEYTGERLMRCEAFTAIDDYLSSSSSTQAKCLIAKVVKNSRNNILLCMDNNQEVSDVFKGVKLRWKSETTTKPLSSGIGSQDRRHYKLIFHKRHRSLVTGEYITHVLKEGKAIKIRDRQRKLYTNTGSYWSHINFSHPASFKTLAMDPEMKSEIIEDLMAFSQAEEYYARIGRAWKRGYLLHGPPGTGKSTMIGAIANLLNYDIYDLELTAVKDNTELRRLLIDISSKSVIVIEDIDCSLDLTGQRRKSKTEGDGKKVVDSHRSEEKEKEKEEVKQMSHVTLSGLLNFIDGLWSASGGERIIVFTTNFVDKLDPALVRKGRMDKRIELGYCGFEAFKVLARNYLGLEGDHEMFGEIEELLREVKITPADVAEFLMPKKVGIGNNNVNICLRSLVGGLMKEKEGKGNGKE